MAKEIVEVTPCKSCKFFTNEYMVGDEMCGHCELHNSTMVFGCDFCSYGKETTGKIVVNGKEVRY